MQESLDQIRNSLWSKLEPYFNNYAKNGEVQNANFEVMFRDIFIEDSQQDVQYVIKNMHRLDRDGSGSVDFPQFANFLFQIHCGQMSLQKRHIKGQMKRGDERLMNFEEFEILLNEAVRFLGVTIPHGIVETIFKNTDTDQDGHITYVQYFQAISKYICKSKAVLLSEKKIKPEPVEEPVVIVEAPKVERVWKRSILREFLWEALRKLYFHYCLGKKVAFTELRALVVSICGQLSEHQVVYVLAGLYELSGTHIEFVPFAVKFFYLIAEVGLARFSQNRPGSLRTLTMEEWIILFRNTFKFLSVYQISNKFLQLVFLCICGQNKTITYTLYLEWVRQFLACQNWYGDRFWFIEDDPDRQGAFSIFYTQVQRPMVRASTTKVGQAIIIKFNFSSYEFAYRVRQRVLSLLIEFDRDKDQQFSEAQIKEALTVLLKQDKNELDYVTRNVFRYDRDGDKVITYDELTNFAVEQHFGEMAIQRLHRKKYYSRGVDRIMNKEQFAKTLNYSLNFIQIEADQKTIDILFDQIDLDHDGWISYEVYFYFLKYYFGSLSVAATKPKIESKKPLSFRDLLLKSLDGLSAFERFVKLLFEQLRYIFLNYDENKNLQFQSNEIQAILLHVFGFSAAEIQFIMLQIFRVDAKFKDHISFEDLCSIILDIYFIHILLMRRFTEFGRAGWKQIKINCQQFVNLVIEACYFITIRPFEEDLKVIFLELDTDKDGYISLWEYVLFIRKYIGRDLSIEDVPPSPKKKPVKAVPESNHKEIETNFVEAIWGELKKLFDLYDGGSKGYLTEAEFKTFAVEVLNEKSDNELKYIFWNLFRLDEDSDMKIEFEQFAPYVLKHAGEISLQRFHLQQPRGKSNLSVDELFLVVSNAYSFLKTMPKSRNIIEIVHQRIAKDGEVSYGAYLSWVSLAIARRFR